MNDSNFLSIKLIIRQAKERERERKPENPVRQPFQSCDYGKLKQKLIRTNDLAIETN